MFESLSLNSMIGEIIEQVRIFPLNTYEAQELGEKSAEEFFTGGQSAIVTDQRTVFLSWHQFGSSMCLAALEKSFLISDADNFDVIPFYPAWKEICCRKIVAVTELRDGDCLYAARLDFSEGPENHRSLFVGVGTMLGESPTKFEFGDMDDFAIAISPRYLLNAAAIKALESETHAH